MMEVVFLKLLKKTLVAGLVLAVTMTVGCGSNKKINTTSSDKNQKTEYITEITKDNVEEVVIEYKEILSYYNDLKNNLKTISDASKNPDFESDLLSAKDLLKNGQTLLASTDTKYKPLNEAKEVLNKMYVKSLDMAEYVLTKPNKYKTVLSEYDLLFKDFKMKMDKVRQDIEKVRGKHIKATDEQLVTEETDKKNKDEQLNKKGGDDEASDKKSDKKDKEEKSSDKDRKSSNSSQSNKRESNPDQAFVPRVSSLNNSLKSEIKNAGSNAGASFKQSGGSESKLESVAVQMFNDLEGDSPIQDSQISEARAIFVEAFKAAFYKN